MKNHVLTFSAFLLLGIALYASPASAFVTTDVAEGAGRLWLRSAILSVPAVLS